MSALFGGYRRQVHHEMAQRIAVAVKGQLTEEANVSVREPQDSKVTKVLMGVPGLVAFVAPDEDRHEYLRHVTVKRPNRNSVRFMVMREKDGALHRYVIR